MMFKTLPYVDQPEDIEADVLEDIEADATVVEVAVDRDVEVEDEVESSDRGTMEVGVDVVAGIDIPDAMLMPDAVKRLEQRIEDSETGQRELKARSLIAVGERASLLEQNMTITRSSMTPEAIEELINRRVEETLAAYEATHAANALEAESQTQNGSDDDNGNGGDGNGGNGNGRNGNGGNGNPNKNNRDARPVVRECTYQDFMKCQPLNFKGTKGVVGLTRWFEKMETMFHISNYPEKYQVKYATCTLLNSALTWWNSHKRTVGTDAAFVMSWRELMKLMAEQPPFKRPNVRGQNVARAYTAGNNERKAYNISLPLCNKCKLHHEGPCTVRCGKCKKETKDKSEDKRLEDVPIVRDFSEVFPEDLPGLPPMRQVKFQIDLVPGAALMARAPYRLAPSAL
ncbi:hypothetical protein Tco_0978301 [Tanacetum coccineum]|uniref:Reverse transcriptase domain-containing protein n=1 Tax=Tanacetum coccineum TaxID=301880 RepID=A0ABQ5EMI9_9ASTR